MLWRVTWGLKSWSNFAVATSTPAWRELLPREAEVGVAAGGGEAVGEPGQAVVGGVVLGEVEVGEIEAGGGVEAEGERGGEAVVAIGGEGAAGDTGFDADGVQAKGGTGAEGGEWAG